MEKLNFKSKLSIKKQEAKSALIFISPALLLLLVFMLYPIVYSFFLSLTSGLGNKSTFVGFKNFARILNDPLFLIALKNTFLILFIQVPIMLISAIVLASLLNDKKLKFKGFFRTAIFLPSVTSLAAYSILFKMLFSFDGFINSFLIKSGITSGPIGWLTEPFLAQIVLIIAMIWRWTGYNMVFYLSAMQNISEDIYEAAAIDGANKVDAFFRITLPLLKPMILFTTVMSTIGTLQLFDEPMNLVSGGASVSITGPGNSLLTLSIYIYNICFKFAPNYGYASAISYVIVILIAILSLIQFYLAREKN